MDRVVRSITVALLGTGLARHAPSLTQVSEHAASKRARMPAVPRAFLAAGAALYLLVLRRPDSLFAPTMWAEDGVVFFKGAVDHGASSLFDGYNGQFLVLQRTVALVAEPLPVAWQPAIYAVVALLVTVGSCSWVLSARWGMPISFPVRVACLFALVCMPGTAEVTATLTNCHWWLAVGVLVIGCLTDPPRPPGRILEIAFVALTALSGFAVLYGLPALLFHAVRTKSRHSLTLVAVAVTGLVIETSYLIASPREGSAGRLTHIGADTTVLLVVKKVFGLAALGDVNFAQSWPLRQAPLWAWTITFVLLALVVALFVALRAPQRYGLLCCVLGAWFLAIWSETRPGGRFSALLLPGIGNRYFVPAIAAVYLLVLMATSRRRLRALVVATTAVLLLVGIASDYHLAPRGHVDWSEFARCVDGSQQTCTVVIPPGWEVVITDRP